MRHYWRRDRSRGPMPIAQRPPLCPEVRGANQGSQCLQTPPDSPRPHRGIRAGEQLHARPHQTYPDWSSVPGGQGVAGSNPDTDPRMRGKAPHENPLTNAHTTPVVGTTWGPHVVRGGGRRARPAFDAPGPRMTCRNVTPCSGGQGSRVRIPPSRPDRGLPKSV